MKSRLYFAMTVVGPAQGLAGELVAVQVAEVETPLLVWEEGPVGRLWRGEEAIAGMGRSLHMDWAYGCRAEMAK